MASVIIFGPTGNIGSVTAKTAAEQGAEVYLAMRDTSKEIPGLDEKAGTFKRIQADLTKPDSVKEAVRSSGAKRAFFYSAHGSPDHMRSTIEAMKDGGIELPIFLSSFTVAGDGAKLREVPQSELIPYLHAQVEIQLEEVYGLGNFVAVRPGGFATNNLRYKEDINKGEVPLFGGSFKADNITHGDMGRVSGTILVNGPKNGQNHVYLYGPERTSTHDGILEIAKALGKDVEITPIDKEAGLQQYIDTGVPPFFAQYMVRVLGSDDVDALVPVEYEEGVENVKLYTGRRAQGLTDWVKENKAMFA